MSNPKRRPWLSRCLMGGKKAGSLPPQCTMSGQMEVTDGCKVPWMDGRSPVTRGGEFKQQRNGRHDAFLSMRGVSIPGALFLQVLERRGLHPPTELCSRRSSPSDRLSCTEAGGSRLSFLRSNTDSATDGALEWMVHTPPSPQRMSQDLMVSHSLTFIHVL